jgi:hypothetical protein
VAGLLANALLVPRIGYLGAAWAALAANSTFALLATWKVSSLFPEASIPPAMFRFTAAGALMTVVFIYMPNAVWIRFVVGLLVYTITLAVLGALNRNDYSLALRLFSTGRSQEIPESAIGKELA